MPDAIAATAGTAPSFGRLALWFVLLVPLDVLAIYVTFFAQSRAGAPLGTIAVVALGLATAWAFGLFHHANGVVLAIVGTIAAPLVAVVLVIAGIVIFVYPRTNTEPPRLLIALDPNQSWAAQTAALRAQLKDSFPPGARESSLISTLGTQGFVVDEARRTARYEWTDKACKNTVEIYWTAQGGLIVTIDDRIISACPTPPRG